jgi:hypothetical protein
MNRLITTVVLLFALLSARGQNITGHEADSLRRSLNRSGQQTTRINALLKLAEYQIFKPAEHKSDLNSAATFINQADQLNVKENSAYDPLIEHDNSLSFLGEAEVSL